MIRFCPNISMLFTELPMLDRISAINDFGFKAFEMQFPYDIPVENLLRTKNLHKQELIIFNLPVGDFTKGGQGLASIPGREPFFRAAVAEAFIYAEALKPKSVNVLAGCPAQFLDKEQCKKTLSDNLNYTAEKFSSIDVTVLFEPINSIDRPGYLINNIENAKSIIKQADHSNLGLVYDLYHMYKMDKNPMKIFKNDITNIHHIQIADYPERSEPGTGKINFKEIFSIIKNSEYDNWIGIEYIPKTKTKDSLKWISKFLI
tara:strand:+ start:52 stop:831 length:780 start_codon:yes stop_codon:yes gene_type:complete